MLGSSQMSPCTSLQSIVTRSVSLQACRELTMVYSAASLQEVTGDWCMGTYSMYHVTGVPCTSSVHVSPATLQHDLCLGLPNLRKRYGHISSSEPEEEICPYLQLRAAAKAAKTTFKAAARCNVRWSSTMHHLQVIPARLRSQQAIPGALRSRHSSRI